MKNVSYRIIASRIQGEIAPEFIGRRFNTQREAIEAFDAIYNTRCGFRIEVEKWVYVEQEGNNAAYEYEESSRIVKSTYR